MNVPSPTRVVLLAGLALLLLSMTSVAPVLAQDEEESEHGKLDVGVWYPSLTAGVNLTQSAYSDNWAGGDQGTVVWTFLANADLRRRVSETFFWTNSLKLAYGQTHQQSEDREWEKPFKSTDRIDYETVGRFTLGYFLDPYFSGRLESQFQDSSDPEGRSLLFNPLLLKESVGVAHEFYGEEDRTLLVRFGAALRHGIRRQFDQPAPSEDTMTESETDGGIELVIDSSRTVLDDEVAWTSKLTFYQPLYYSAKSDFEDVSDASLVDQGIDPDIEDFGLTMDIDWENVFSTQLGKVVTVSLYVRWLYDKYDNSVSPVLADDGTLANPEDVLTGIRKAGQFKQTLALGLTYRFY